MGIAVVLLIRVMKGKCDERKDICGLNLRSVMGTQKWQGYLICGCSFRKGFSRTIEDLTDSLDRREEDYLSLSRIIQTSAWIRLRNRYRMREL